MQDSLQDDGLDAPCNLAPLTEKNNQITPHTSPMGVNQKTIMAGSTTKNTGMEVSPQAHVRISKSTTTAEAETTPIALSTSQRLILQSASKSTTQESNPSISDNEASQKKIHLKEIHDHTNMLFHVFSDNGMKDTSYHVSDFAGLSPAWPIIKFSMACTGTAKKKG